MIQQLDPELCDGHDEVLSPALTAIGLCVAGLLFLGASIGFAETLSSPGKGGVAGQIIGVCCLLLMVAFGLLAVMTGIATQLVVSSEGLTWRYNLRTRHIAWPDIQSVGVGLNNSWACPRIVIDGKPTLIKKVIGTSRWAENVAADIRAAQETVTASTAGAFEPGSTPA